MKQIVENDAVVSSVYQSTSYTKKIAQGDF